MNVSRADLNKITEKANLEITSFKALAGGDINEVFLVSGSAGEYVLKVNNAEKFPLMFEAEKQGLDELRKAEAVKIPEIFSNGKIESLAYLLLEYIPTGNKNNGFWQDFGHKMALLHQNTSETFGFNQQNYIGSLPQYNESHENAAEFYIDQRLEPQIRMAHDNGFKLGSLNKFFRNVSDEIPDEKPSLVHGDLWGGNFLISKKSEPVLIDPAVAYAPREMDIGMMQLFGGFDEKIFIAYNEVFPLQENWQQRLDIWQLYYLLVHLNIFGAGYLSRVKEVINKYC